MTDARARKFDPATSHEAAAVAPTIDLKDRIVRVLVMESFGLTTSEIAATLREPRDSISPRMKALVAEQRVVNSGHTRIPPGHTRKSIIWVAPIAGETIDMFEREP